MWFASATSNVRSSNGSAWTSATARSANGAASSAAAVDRPRPDAERGPGRDHLRLAHRVAGSPHLDLGAPLLHVPRFVLLVVELEAQRVPLADEEELPDVLVGMRPDELPPPRLLDALRLERKGVEPAQVRRRQVVRRRADPTTV